MALASGRKGVNKNEVDVYGHLRNGGGGGTVTVLDTKEAVINNEATGKATGALVTKNIYDSLTANNNQIYFDYQNDKYGFNTDPSRGADTFHPFSQGGVENGSWKITASVSGTGPSVVNPSYARADLTLYISIIDGELSITSGESSTLSGTGQGQCGGTWSNAYTVTTSNFTITEIN